MNSQLEGAIADLRSGRPVLVVDHTNRENEGDLVFAAEKATRELMAFLVKHTSGFVCVAVSGEVCERLRLPPMTELNNDPYGTAYRVTIDAATGITTGISARDRARTARVMADPGSVHTDLTRPGHVVPLRARDGGVLAREGHTEAAVDLMKLSGLHPVGVLCEVVSRTDPTRMANGAEIIQFADEHNLAVVPIADLVATRRQQNVWRAAEARIPTKNGTFRAYAYRSVDGREHVAFVLADPGNRKRVPVRMHSECVTGDVFGSCRCDCGEQLDAAIEYIATVGCNAT